MGGGGGGGMWWCCYGGGVLLCDDYLQVYGGFVVLYILLIKFC